MTYVKITPVGGYMYGDGPIPGGLDPDTFYKAFSGKIIEAMGRGLTEIGFTDEEVAAQVLKQQTSVNLMIDEAPVRVYNGQDATELLQLVDGEVCRGIQ
jgi:hypothetical protein